MDELLNVSAAEERFVIERVFHHQTLEERAALFQGELNLEGELEFGETKGREIW